MNSNEASQTGLGQQEKVRLVTRKRVPTGKSNLEVGGLYQNRAVQSSGESKRGKWGRRIVGTVHPRLSACGGLAK